MLATLIVGQHFSLNCFTLHLEPLRRRRRVNQFWSAQKCRRRRRRGSSLISHTCFNFSDKNFCYIRSYARSTIIFAVVWPEIRTKYYKTVFNNKRLLNQPSLCSDSKFKYQGPLITSHCLHAIF